MLRFFSNFMKQSLTRYIVTMVQLTHEIDCLLHVEQELGGKVTLQEI